MASNGKPFPKAVEIKPTKTQLALSITREAGMWVLETLTIENDRVINRVTTNPDLKAIAFEAFKIQAVKAFWEE